MTTWPRWPLPTTVPVSQFPTGPCAPRPAPQVKVQVPARGAVLGDPASDPLEADLDHAQHLQAHDLLRAELLPERRSQLGPDGDRPLARRRSRALRSASLQSYPFGPKLRFSSRLPVSGGWR